MNEKSDARYQENIRNKAMFKALETPEEKRARRLAKKLEKDKKKKEKLGWDDEHLSYTNLDNPFGDPNLHRPFIWKKKFEKEGITDVPESKLLEINTHKLEENKLELEKVKKRRWLYEKEKEARDSEVERMQREKEAALFKEWEKQEDKFHLEQALLRSEIRINDHRAKPIDLLAKYISDKNEELSLEMHEPYTYLNGLTTSDLEDLLEDIKVYVQLEQGQNSDYWRDITIIVEDELDKLKKIVAEEKDEYYSHRREGINNAVRDDIGKIFKGKTYVQLELLAQQVADKIQTQENIDIGYWESLLKQLKAFMAKARLREKHQDVLRRKLFQFKMEQGVENQTPLFPISLDAPLLPASTSTSKDHKPKLADDPDTNDPADRPSTSKKTGDVANPEGTEEIVEEEEEEEQENEEDILEKCAEEYDEGRYSPTPMLEKNLERGVVVVELTDEIKRIEYARRCYLKTGSTKDSFEDLMFKQLSEGMALDDQEFNGNAEAADRYTSNNFSVQISLPHQTFLWRDKYKPRKPRFFNRVHTGFEWNKYNQTHYDFDNPPPKIVQGYKFNIFYPDLINKGATPKYTVTPCYEEGRGTAGPSPDFAVLRFGAGPPYEDIAFKIVNREWECSYKKGFRCQFYNNIFQLWFHFKRYRYRR